MLFTILALTVLIAGPIVAYAYLLMVLPGQRLTERGHQVLNDLILLGVRFAVWTGLALLTVLVLATLLL